MSATISANELKTKGISVLERIFTEENSEVIITNRGKQCYVVMPIKSYNQLREYELEIALLEAKRDIKNKKYYKESVNAHLKRIKNG